MRTIGVVGVPWSVHELAPAVRDAAAASARILLVDTAEMLARRDLTLDLEVAAVETLDAQNAWTVLREAKPDCILSITEMTMECAARVRELAGQRGTPSETEHAVLDKPSTRAILAARGLTRVRWWETTTSEVVELIRGLPLPLVLKPRALTGSAGVRLVRTIEDIDGLEQQYDSTASLRSGRDRLVLEAFVSGDEISAEGLVVDGVVTLYTLTDKVNTGPPHFVETGHVMPSRRHAAWHERIGMYLQNCADALGIITSPIHAELKISGDVVELIELHTRFGGDNLVRLLEETFGVRPFQQYFEAMLDGRAPVASPSRQVCGIAFFTGWIGQPLARPSFAFPHPEAVLSIDYDRRRQPKLEAYEGVKLLYWRAGEVFFSSRHYEHVFENVTFVDRERSPAVSMTEAV